MGQSNAPDPIEWATTALPADVVDPGLANKQAGWAALQVPPFSWINWIYNTLALWVTYFASALVASLDSFVTVGLDVVQIPHATDVTVNLGKAIAAGIEVELPIAETITLPAAGTAGLGNVILYTLHIDATGTINTTTTNVLGSTVADAIAGATWPDPGTAETLLAVVADENGLATFDTAHIFDLRQLKPVSGRIIEDGTVTEGNLAFEVLKARNLVFAAEAGDSRVASVQIVDADDNAITSAQRCRLEVVETLGFAGSLPNLGPASTGTRLASTTGAVTGIYETDAAGALAVSLDGDGTSVGEVYLIVTPIDTVGASVSGSATWA